MADFRAIMKSGHPPTLLAAFLYFDFCFAVWVLNGAMGPFISEHFALTPAQTGFMLSVPILAGALMRFPLGVLAQYIGRKNAALTEMALIMAAMAYGFFFIDDYSDVIAMGVLLGIAGASFGVALSLGRGGIRRNTKAWRWALPAPATPEPCWRRCSARRWPPSMAGGRCTHSPASRCAFPSW